MVKSKEPEDLKHRLYVKTGIATIYGLAKILNLNKNTLRRTFHGKRIRQTPTATRIAQFLEVEEAEIFQAA